MLISPDYIEANRELHARSKYGSTGSRWATQIYELARQNKARDILDYGCGKGSLMIALKEKFDASVKCRLLEYDPAIAGKETKPARVDIVVCTDVLEHVEPECLDAVLDDLKTLTRRAIFLVVSTMPASKVFADGRNAHLIVQPMHWWLPMLMERFRLIRAADLGPVFQVIGFPL